MKVGVYFQYGNHEDWDRYIAKSDGAQTKTDQEVLDEELALADLVEPLGFDSYWAIDHYITPYGMTGGVLQHLTYIAGRTSKIDVGTMVLVLPWYEPLMACHALSVLDNVLKGRQLTLCVGRGAAIREFDGFRVPMGDARGRYNETLDIIRLSLENEWFSYDGEHFKLPLTSVRPKYRNPQRILENMKSGWASAGSLPLAANAGLGMLLTNQKTWAEYRQEVSEFNKIRAERGWGPLQPSVAVRAACFEDEAEAWDVIKKHNLEATFSSNNHYQLMDSERFAKTPGYEQYAKVGETQATEEQIDEFVSKPQAWGTPDQVYQQLLYIQQMTSASELIINFKYGNMPAEVAERSMRLFAKEVLPRLHAYDAKLVSADSDVVLKPVH